MAISAMDECLAHQTPETFDRVSTSDRNFYDRYYLNLHSRSSDLFVVLGIGQYPNLGTTDAFALFVRNGRQHVLRCSRELGPDRSNTTVGPLGVEVVEPLKSLRFWCDDNEHDISFDLTFTGRAPAVEEPRTLMRKGARLTMDTSRYTQMGRWRGRIDLKGERIDISEDEYLGIRDHSWGVRPVGEREPLGIQINEYAGDFGLFHIFAPIQFEDFQIKVFVEENHDGSLIVEECIKVENYENGGAVHQLGKPVHKMKYVKGVAGTGVRRVALRGRERQAEGGEGGAGELRLPCIRHRLHAQRRVGAWAVSRPHEAGVHGVRCQHAGGPRRTGAAVRAYLPLRAGHRGGDLEHA